MCTSVWKVHFVMYIFILLVCNVHFTEYVSVLLHVRYILLNRSVHLCMSYKVRFVKYGCSRLLRYRWLLYVSVYIVFLSLCTYFEYGCDIPAQKWLMHHCPGIIWPCLLHYEHHHSIVRIGKEYWMSGVGNIPAIMHCFEVTLSSCRDINSQELSN